MAQDDRLARNTLYLCKDSSGIFVTTNSDLKCSINNQHKANSWLLEFDEEVKKELSDSSASTDIKTKDGEIKFIKNFRDSFNEVNIQ